MGDVRAEIVRQGRRSRASQVAASVTVMPERAQLAHLEDFTVLASLLLVRCAPASAVCVCCPRVGRVGSAGSPAAPGLEWRARNRLRLCHSSPERETLSSFSWIHPPLPCC